MTQVTGGYTFCGCLSVGLNGRLHSPHTAWRSGVLWGSCLDFLCMQDRSVGSRECVVLNKAVVKFAVPVVAGALALTGCGGSGGGGDTVKIAFQGPLSGDNVALGENMQNGVKLAIDQANAKGDLGFKLEYVASDDQGLPDKATAAAQKVIDDESVVAVVGPAFSGATNTASPLYAEAGLVTVSPSATNPSLTDPENNFTSLLRGVPNDNQQGAGMATYYAKKLKAKKVYVLMTRPTTGWFGGCRREGFEGCGHRGGPEVGSAEDAGLQCDGEGCRQFEGRCAGVRGLLPGCGAVREEVEGSRLQGCGDFG